MELRQPPSNPPKAVIPLGLGTTYSTGKRYYTFTVATHNSVQKTVQALSSSPQPCWSKVPSSPQEAWEEGYALDLISKVSPNLVFSSSTWVFFTPAELESYLSKLASNNCKNIIISEPFWGSKYSFNEENIESYHLETGVWLHNWPAYFNKYGFKCIDKEIFSYKHPISPRPDIRIFIGNWKLI